MIHREKEREREERIYSEYEKRGNRNEIKVQFCLEMSKAEIGWLGCKSRNRKAIIYINI